MNWKMAKKIRRKERVNNALLFLVVFILFIFVFGGMCVWTIININKERQSLSTSDSTSSDTSTPASFTDEDTRNLLIVTVDGNDARGFVVLRSDPSRSRIWALSFPRETVADVNTSEVRLYELYTSQGIAAVKTAIQKISGLEINNYAVFTYENLEKLIDHYEAGLIMNIPENVNYTDNNTTIRLDSGPRTLRATQVTGLLRYPSWSGGLKQQADVQAQVAAAMINQYMKDARASKADSDFGAFVNLAAKTDVLMPHYISAKQGLTYLSSRNDGSICAGLTLDGQYQGSGDAVRYYAADNIQSSLKSAFGQTR